MADDTTSDKSAFRGIDEPFVDDVDFSTPVQNTQCAAAEPNSLMTPYMGIYKDLEATEIAPRSHMGDVFSRRGDFSSLDLRELYHRREIAKTDPPNRFC